MTKTNRPNRFFLLTMFSCVFFVHALQAQVSIGPKVGLGLSTFTVQKSLGFYDPYPVTKYISTPQVGVILNVQLSKIFSIRPELLYNQRGYRVENNFSGIADRFSVRINYIELPINLVVGGSLGPGKLELFGGPAIAYGFGGKGKYETNGSQKTITVHTGKHPDESPQFENQYYNPFHASLNIGFGYRIKGVVVQFAYNWGLTNVQCHFSNSTLESERHNYVNKASAFTFGLAYLLGKKQ